MTDKARMIINGVDLEDVLYRARSILMLLNFVQPAPLFIKLIEDMDKILKDGDESPEVAD